MYTPAFLIGGDGVIRLSAAANHSSEKERTREPSAFEIRSTSNRHVSELVSLMIRKKSFKPMLLNSNVFFIWSAGIRRGTSVKTDVAVSGGNTGTSIRDYAGQYRFVCVEILARVERHQ